MKYLWVKGNLHDKMRVPLKGHDTLPRLLPVPKLDAHVVRAGKHQRQRRMHRNATARLIEMARVPNVVNVRLPRRNLFVGVVVEDSDVQVVAPDNDPRLACFQVSGV